MTLPRTPYHRDALVIALAELYDDWGAARTFSRMDDQHLIEDLDDIVASFPYPLSKPLLHEKLKECLHGERLAQVNAISEQRRVA